MQIKKGKKGEGAGIMGNIVTYVIYELRNLK